MNIEISLEDLLKNGSHFGHNKKRWNPNFNAFSIKGSDFLKSKMCVPFFSP